MYFYLTLLFFDLFGHFDSSHYSALHISLKLRSFLRLCGGKDIYGGCLRLHKRLQRDLVEKCSRIRRHIHWARYVSEAFAKNPPGPSLPFPTETRRRHPLNAVYETGEELFLGTCDSRGVGGVGVLVNTSMAKNIDSFEQITIRIGRLRMRRCGPTPALTIFVAYAPKSSYEEE
ncbi:hypothetical protein RB195_009893 [Necator americanus]|uniref:Uncharacterized protein n=1 Tax=Necator americanus TaxID=51031 RepID=A0ABR1CVH7_NECAM